MAGKQKPNWHLSFDISPDLTIRRGGEAIHKATAIAKRGDLAYMAELDLVNWSEDIAAFFEQVRAVFFEAEVSGIPDFPNMADASPAVDEVVEVDEIAAEVDEPEIPAEGDDDYEITFYPAEGNADTPQPSLWQTD